MDIHSPFFEFCVFPAIYLHCTCYVCSRCPLFHVACLSCSSALDYVKLRLLLFNP